MFQFWHSLSSIASNLAICLENFCRHIIYICTYATCGITSVEQVITTLVKPLLQLEIQVYLHTSTIKLMLFSMIYIDLATNSWCVYTRYMYVENRLQRLNNIHISYLAIPTISDNMYGSELVKNGSDIYFPFQLNMLCMWWSKNLRAWFHLLDLLLAHSLLYMDSTSRSMSGIV